MGRSIAEARVIRSWRLSYDPALSVRAGDRVTTGREDDEYPGWIWCENASGLGGWLPSLILDGNRITQDFNAMELSVDPGDTVEVLENCLVWTLARRRDGVSGWLPSTHLAR